MYTEECLIRDETSLMTMREWCTRPLEAALFEMKTGRFWTEAVQ